MRMQKLDKALTYAQAAADSYSQWGLNAYAECLTEMGRYKEAEEVQKANQERYPDGFCWYRWCQTTGRGDLKAARAMSMASAKESEASSESGDLNEVAVFLELEGQKDRARACSERGQR